ncbi:MAG: acyl-CoA carboxylase subunit beta, partial [Candidatus Omnitrophica bacterium]|nr:acyl-CoA carboxylase subunit beta [Candidatus Omnitrophota bacterium]
MAVIGTSAVKWNPDKFQKNESFMDKLVEQLKSEEEVIQLGGGPKNIEKQHLKKRLTARERIAKLIDADTYFMELGLFCANGMYEEFGGCPAAGNIIGVAMIHGKETMIVAHDATVKAGAHFEMTVKKTLRAQEIAMKNNIP